MLFVLFRSSEELRDGRFMMTAVRLTARSAGAIPTTWPGKCRCPTDQWPLPRAPPDAQPSVASSAVHVEVSPARKLPVARRRAEPVCRAKGSYISRALAPTSRPPLDHHHLRAHRRLHDAPARRARHASPHVS
jgi:hypothetical protein